MTAKTRYKSAPDRSIKRRSRGSQVDLETLFSWSIPEPNSGCWIWDRATSLGYGVLRLGRRTAGAHRVAYEISTGSAAPQGLDVCHHCDVRSCVNPGHLFLGTRADNMRDCANKGRIRVPGLAGDDCPNSKLTSAQVLAIRADARSNRAIAREYGVDRGTIAAIKRRKTWRSV